MLTDCGNYSEIPRSESMVSSGSHLTLQHPSLETPGTRDINNLYSSAMTNYTRKLPSIAPHPCWLCCQMAISHRLRTPPYETTLPQHPHQSPPSSFFDHPALNYGLVRHSPTPSPLLTPPQNLTSPSVASAPQKIPRLIGTKHTFRSPTHRDILHLQISLVSLQIRAAVFRCVYDAHFIPFGLG